MFQKSLLAILVTGLFASQANATGFDLGSLIISRTVYQDVGDAANLAVGSILPNGGTAVGDGSFSNVFKNETPDPSFGVTSAIYLDQVSTTSGAVQKTIAVNPSLMTSSYASKSELALNVSTDGSAITFMGYKAAVGTLDVSNSNTSAVKDPTNGVTSTYQRAVGQVDIGTGNVTVTGVNAYSGNNGRAAVLANGNYYMVGNAGNSSTNAAGTKPTNAILDQLSANTGVQMISASNPGNGNTTVIGQLSAGAGTGKGGQYGFDVASTGAAADKTGKDDNFRGETVYKGTLYVTKGSGGNGVNTVYQVGATGALNNGGTLASNSSISILPGLPTTLASSASASHPFGIGFANDNMMIVGDEGTATYSTGAATGVLQEWTKGANGVWSLGKSFNDFLGGIETVGIYQVKQDGVRNLSVQQNADGSFVVFLTTSTISNDSNHDQGADPNKVYAVNFDANGNEIGYTLLESASIGTRFGGVASLNVAAVPETDTYAMLLAGLGILGFVARRKQN